MSDPKAVSRVLPVIGAFVAGLVLVLGVLVYLTGHSASPIGRAMASVGGPFHLEDQSGKPVSDVDMKGRPFLVFFGYTHCPDVCPTTLFEISEVMKALGKDADRTGALFITVDPARDTPAAMKTYISSRVFPKNIIGLTGTPAQIAQAAKEYVVYYQKEGTGSTYTMDHSTALYLMDPNGKFHSVIADGLTPEEDARQISEAMRGA